MRKPPAVYAALIRATALGGILSCATPSAANSQVLSGLDTLDIVRHARVLAADSLLGRATGTRELDVAARYIASVCADIGLRALGENYLLDVPLVSKRFTSSTELTVTIAGRSRAFAHGRDFMINFSTGSTLKDFQGTAVLVGDDQEIRQSETTLTHAIAVTLGTVSPQASQHLEDGGATAMVHLVADPDAYNNIQANFGEHRIFARDTALVSSLAPSLPSVILSPALSGQLYRALTSGATVNVRLHLDTIDTNFTSYNVGCVLDAPTPGPNDKVIAFTAHYDHLGIGASNAWGDSIYNGFSDNAAGVGMLLGIARAAVHNRDLFKSNVVFLFFTAEEIGLIGSDYFVANPPIPLERFAAVINLDAGAPSAPPWSWRIAGGDLSRVGTLAVDAALARGWSATTSPAVPNSDYYPFWRNGVPAIFIVPGVETFEGLSADSTRALRTRWDRYHQLGDEWNPAFPLSGLLRYAEYALLVARQIDATLENDY